MGTGRSWVPVFNQQIVWERFMQRKHSDKRQAVTPSVNCTTVVNKRDGFVILNYVGNRREDGP